MSCAGAARQIRLRLFPNKTGPFPTKPFGHLILAADVRALAGRFISKRRLRRKLVWSDDQAVYTCRATVPFLPGNMHDAITLDVACKSGEAPLQALKEAA